MNKKENEKEVKSETTYDEKLASHKEMQKLSKSKELKFEL
jgi:hypothetical protein